MNPAVLRLEMPLTPDDALVLKQPLGRLIIDSDINEQTILTELERAKLVISVGDRSTARLVSFQIIPDISVIDYKERRMKVADDDHCDSRIMPVMHCSNPAGTISKEAVAIINLALSGPYPVRIVVKGEEDMLALPLIAIAPVGSVVFYGQPLQGIVVVNVSYNNQKMAKDLMDRVRTD
jgi:GTP-dependent dephospho-CoA kinase